MSYTTKAEVELILSADGEDDLVEDLSGGDQTTLWNSILTETDSIFNLYLCDLYDPASIASNNWVSEKAKWVAAYLITRRRGEPGYYAGMYEEVIKQLEMIREGRLKIPANDGSVLAMSSANMPAIANMIYDDRSKVLPMRVDTITSVGEMSGNELPYWHRFWAW